MLPKKQRVKTALFGQIVRSRLGANAPLFRIKYLRGNFKPSLFAVAVPKSVCRRIVDRNAVKRRISGSLEEGMKKNSIAEGFASIIFANKHINAGARPELEQQLLSVFQKIGCFKLRD
ncbi:MAG: hypothetical protein A3G59_00735 [Candidatus Taylorbacteria bacterium RIFCSPLOWO2_12_FULL_47_20]|uniref:Uncharacterized protein n=2 Tax=Candidatus Tayloriibacteriota TaxID=1817919 RepID=A0A1G2P739_9BACT|nr:MAG: hypothetical protein A3H68_01545 [Candidatus Taylorbacteria bacterium RIFCSPLOWO2_02_FULL_46_40]OHA44166.1 MAG: hypothetical protein A3G59_00735 [Candidatus Taylorbacteria bacterium RIFCSPLOWO2_12_FULL_47_20]